MGSITAALARRGASVSVGLLADGSDGAGGGRADGASRAAKKGNAAVKIQAMTLLRDPIARTVSQFEHHISRNRFGATAADPAARAAALKVLASPQVRAVGCRRRR